MSQDQELLPCPSCGNAPWPTPQNGYVPSPQAPSGFLVGVHCGCGWNGAERPTDAEAIAAWNTRASDGRVRELEPYRSQDASGSPDTAEAVGWSWIEELALEARATRSRRAPAALHIEAPRSDANDTTVIALYDGTELLACATIFRDPMNFAVLVRWQAPEALLPAKAQS